MNWRDTLLKSSDIKWKQKVKSTDDGKLDFDLHLPLTELFERQALLSYLQGAYDVLMFQTNFRSNNPGKTIEVEDIAKHFIECGLPQVAVKLREAQP